jgi:molybdopterin converting factor subunit 1
MRVRVQLYARARDLVGAPQVELQLPEAGTVADLRRELGTRFPSVAGLLEKCAVAVDQEIADDSLSLRQEALAAILPPVSGG